MNQESSSQKATGPKKPSPRLKELDIFSGSWDVTGQNRIAAPQAADGQISGTETYEWMDGDFYLVCHWDRDFGAYRHIGTGMISFDEEKQSFITYNFDNLGFTRLYKITREGDKWLFNGDSERATYVFSDSGNTMTVDWEFSKNGKDWAPLCHLVQKKNGRT